MYRFLLPLLLLTTYRACAQSWEVSWGSESRRSSSQILDVLPDNGEDFYIYRQSFAQILQLPKVTRYVNGLPVVTKRISQRVGENIVLLEELEVFNGRLLAFMSDKRDGSNSLYMVRYDSEIDPLGEPEMIYSYPLPKGWSNHGSFNVLTSRNKRYLCVEYIIPGKRDLFERYGYKVLDTAFRVVSQGEYEMPYSSRNASVDLRYLTDQGDYILGLSVYSDNRGSLWKDYNALEKTVLVHVKEDELSKYELQIEGKRVFDIGLSSLDSILIVTGTYGEAYSSGSQGVFLQRINLKRQEVVDDCFHFFPREFITQDLTQSQIDRMERREGRRHPAFQLMNYAIRGIHLLPDGSTVVAAEQFYVFQQNASDTKGVTQTTYHYYFNDLVTYKISASGEFDWIVRLPKEQHSVNDDGYYSSVKTLISGDKLLCLFNDNSKNYDGEGNFIDLLREISFPARKKSYVLAVSEIDLFNGNVHRRVLCDYAQSDGFVVLHLSPTDYRNRQLLLYAEGRRDRFGILKF